jgi:hypothetical protein
LNAGNFSLTGGGNTALGADAMNSNTTGFSNTAMGDGALVHNTTGARNTVMGKYALQTNTIGNDNTAVGLSALDANTTASGNTAVGEAASQVNQTGFGNTAVGSSALLWNTGSNNIGVGAGAGSGLSTGNNNIDIGNGGVAAEANTIRIGGAGTQTATYIAGINGATSSSGVAVFVNSSGQLGTTTSSARFKDDIQDMSDSTSALMRLRPVRFRYKKDIDPSGLEQYGLVAEEVAKVYPTLVVYDDNGKPQTVRYHFVNAMLLNEVQKQARQIETQKAQLAQQAREMKAQMDALTVRLMQIESVVGAQGYVPAVEASYKARPGF